MKHSLMPEEKYINDPVFHTVVDALHAFLDQHELTPMELRQAVMYACYLKEIRSVTPMFIPKTQWHVKDRSDFDEENI